MIFVFGSNKDGIHGAGAAKFAFENCGAEWGVGEGLTGESYALPTKGHGITDMTLEEIEPHIKAFCDFSKANLSKSFLLTPVGTGLAGHSKRDIMRIFQKYGIRGNVYLSATWVND